MFLSQAVHSYYSLGLESTALHVLVISVSIVLAFWLGQTSRLVDEAGNPTDPPIQRHSWPFAACPYQDACNDNAGHASSLSVKQLAGVSPGSSSRGLYCNCFIVNCNWIVYFNVYELEGKTDELKSTFLLLSYCFFFLESCASSVP
ncbi:hypothetical protein QVD17_42232 [Tagetes erecta]|uniref:Uncharacterized protein n=1 Tax=Tagetes erecta TaxID=13708 RepID=A0AAD8N8Q9_TARER|nr:hypothetical protein QVD17_42232 [Tagetes erecta]